MASSDDDASTRSWRRWIAGGVFLIFFAFLLWEIVNPYRGQRFEKIPHGDHVHYVPKDRNPDVSVSKFPTRKPGPDERITPEGQVVPIQEADGSP